MLRPFGESKKPELKFHREAAFTTLWSDFSSSVLPFRRSIPPMWHTKVVKRYKTGESVPEDYVEDRSTPLVLSATAAQQRKQKMHAILTPRSTNDPFQDIDPSGPSVPFGPKSEPTSPLRLKSSDSGTSPQWFETGMELRKTEIQLEQASKTKNGSGCGALTSFPLLVYFF